MGRAGCRLNPSLSLERVDCHWPGKCDLFFISGLNACMYLCTGELACIPSMEFPVDGGRGGARDRSEVRLGY